jgi:hypothetical protein
MEAIADEIADKIKLEEERAEKKKQVSEFIWRLFGKVLEIVWKGLKMIETLRCNL